MRPILCVIDLGDSAVKVLDVASSMAFAHKSPLKILYPFRLIHDSYRGNAGELKAQLEEEARHKFSSIKDQVVPLLHVPHEFQPDIGFPADRIDAYVKRNKLDMIVIGQRQANAINEPNGMALQSLIKNSKLPFLIVPDEIDAEIMSQFH